MIIWRGYAIWEFPAVQRKAHGALQSLTVSLVRVCVSLSLSLCVCVCVCVCQANMNYLALSSGREAQNCVPWTSYLATDRARSTYFD